MVFEGKQAVVRADALDFGLQRRRDVARHFIRDDGDAFVGFESKANLNSVARTGRKFGVNRIDGETVRHLEVLRITRKFRSGNPLFDDSLTPPLPLQYS